MYHTESRSSALILDTSGPAGQRAELTHAFTILHGEQVDDPSEDGAAASIATFVPKDYSVFPLEIRLVESAATYPTLRMILLTLVEFLGVHILISVGRRAGACFAGRTRNQTWNGYGAEILRLRRAATGTCG